MGEKVDGRSPEANSSFVNKLFFWWFNPIITTGYKKPLTAEDIWELEDRDMCQEVGENFKKIWEKELEKSRNAFFMKNKKEFTNEAFDGKQSHSTISGFDYSKSPYKVSLCKTMFKQYWKMMAVAVFYKLLNDTIQFLKPTLLSSMINFTETPSAPVYQGYFIAAAMYIVAVLQAICLQQYFNKCYLIGMQIRTSLITVIYDKALKISNSAKQGSTLGEIVNLMSTDAQRLMDLMTYVNILWSGPYQIILSVVLLWNQLQAAVLAGLGVMIIIIPLNGILIKKMRLYSTENMKLKDERMKMMNEVLNGIKVLKMYAWEPSFEKQIEDVRKKELKSLRKVAVLKAVSSFLWNCTPFFVTITSFGVYLALSPDNVLDSSKTFVSISLFDIMKFPLVMLPFVFTALVQAQVSVKRILKFLMESEIDKKSVNRKHDGEDQIKIEDGTFKWNKNEENILENIKINIKPGELVAIVGHVGCGKSSLISAMLGEMEKQEGYVGLRGSVAYVPQQAWIQNATLKENILFGKKLAAETGQEKYTQVTSFTSIKTTTSGNIVDEKFYNRTIQATALKSDFEILEGGDQTEIGEKGINLSGGQKQRVSLARAIFQDSDVYLLDDPLSAVDSHVGKHIFENVIGPNGLLKNKTRVLVTHGLRFLPKTDRIIVIEKGQVTETGRYEELMGKKAGFSKFVEEYASKKQNNDDDSSMTENDVKHEDLDSFPNNLDEMDEGDCIKTDFISDLELRKSFRDSIRKTRSRSKSTSSSTISKLSNRKLQIKLEKYEKREEPKGKLIEKEASAEGSVKASVFLRYFKAVGTFMCFIILLSEALYQVSVIGASIWISDWSEDGDNLSTEEFREQIGLRLGVYGALGAAQAFFVMADVYTLAIGCLEAARKMHQVLLHNILRAPASFFDTTPLGRIVNRFSKDVYTVDDTLPWAIRQWNGCMFQVVGIIAVIMYSTPIFGAVVLPIAILYYIAQRFYVRTSRQLKRIENVTRSPIYSHFSETVSGSTVLRAFDQGERFTKISADKVDFNQKNYYANVISNRWLAIRLDIIGNAIVFFAALFAVIQRDTVNGAIAGLSISYALNVTSTLNWLVRQTSETEIHVVSVERLKEYSDVESEAPWDIPKSKPDKQWPNKGLVEFSNYSTRYRKGLELVVKNVDVNIKPGEKVGIVGRTGAGKSSLTLALFRIIEAAEGSIKIDGIDISQIGLHSLRSSITIIPQDPVLFSGTLRMNLDPFERYTDDEVWNGLEYSYLKEYVSNLPEKLMHICTEGGENLSVGQRQLVCLARALLRRSRVLILDEATAAVDLQTDDLIQNTIRDQFNER